MGIETAILGAAVLGVGGTIYASSQAKKAAEAQAGAMTQAAEEASDIEWKMYQQSRGDVAPWRAAGEKALGDVVNMIEKGPGEFVPSEQPGYKFGYEEFVEKPTLRLASATGALGGGGTQKALTRYAQDYASQEYDNFLTRWYKSLTPYQSLAGIGQTVAAQQGQNALTTGQNLAQNALLTGQNVGQVRASGYIDQANLWGNLAGGMGQNVLIYTMAKKMGLFKQPVTQSTPAYYP